MTDYDKRDKEHIKEMKKYHRFNTTLYRDALRADAVTNDWADDLTPYERRRAREFMKNNAGDFIDFINDDLLSIEYTGVHPMSGGNTRGYGNLPTAKHNEFFVVLLMAYGGPSYGIRAKAREGRHYGFDFSDIVFVYHDWACGYEEDVYDEGLWTDVLSRLTDCWSMAEILEKLEENGERVCANCGEWFEARDDEYYCDECAAIVCNECGETYDESELFDIEGSHMCESCASNNGYSRCESCATWYTDRNMFDVMTCWDCAIEEGLTDDDEEE